MLERATTNIEKMNKQEKFPTRPGTVDYGKDYESLMSAYYSLRLSLDDSVADFKLSTNNEDMGDFDDVVLEVKFESGEEHLYALQLKHKDKNLTLAALTGDEGKGKFNLIKYCKAYEKIRKKLKPKSSYDAKFKNFYFILYTNAAVEYDEKGKKIDVEELQIPSTDLSIVKHNVCAATKFLNVADEKDYVIFEFKNNKNRAMDEEFLKQFLFYTNQMNAKEMERIINNTILDTYKNCDPNVVTKYLNYFNYWCRGDFGTIKLTKSDVRLKLAEILITPLIPEVDLSKLKRYEEKSVILESVINEFNVTLIPNTKRKVVETALGTILEPFNQKFKIFIVDNDQNSGSWSLPLSYSKPELTSMLHKINIKIPISFQSENYQDWSLKKLYILAWHLDMTALIVKSDESSRKVVTSAVKLCNNNGMKKRFVIFDKNLSRNNFSDDWKVFLNLGDLLTNTQQLYNNICEQFQISLQGRNAIPLQQLVKDEPSLQQVITVKELVEMLDDSFTIGSENQELLKHYVTRYSPLILIKPEAIDAIKSDVFVIIYQNNDKLQKCPEKFEKTVETVVILAEGNCTQEQFCTISSMNPHKNCHLLRAIDFKGFEWIQSSGSVEKLREYQVDLRNLEQHHFVVDTEIHNQFKNKVNILCADPGMGKSVAMDFLKHTCSSDNWTIKVNLPTHINFFKSVTCYDHETILNYFANLARKSSFVAGVIKAFLAKRRIIWFWDSFDELSKSCMNPVITIIKGLNSDGYVQWIAARNYSKDILESTFHTLSITLTQFSDEDQQNYIKMRCKDQCDEFGYDFSEVLQVINRMYKNINVLHNRDDYHKYSGVPLQIYMVTGIFKQNPKKYMNEMKIVTVVDIYNEFIKGKFDFFFEKADANFENYRMQQITEKFRKMVVEEYEIAALKASLSKDAFETLGLDCEDFLKEVAEKGDSLGIIVGVCDEKKAVFAHKTYEEFLTASWLSRNFKNNETLVKNLFCEEFSNVRLMFDMLVASDSPAHLAVLLNNLEILKKYNNISTSRDKIGRNLLQVICSWGQRYPLLTVVDDNPENTIVSIANARKDKVEKEDFRQVLCYLLTQQFDPFEKDEFLKWNAFEYADETLSLAVIEVLLKDHQIDLEKLRNNSDTRTVLYYSIIFELSNLFHAITSKPYFEYEEDLRRNVLQVAAEFNRTSFVSELLKFPKYQAAINNTNDPKRFSPLFSAVYNNNLEMVETLLEHGANINGTGVALLSVAAYGGSTELCKLLIQKGASVNDSDLSRNSPLSTAIMKNHVEIAKLFLENGASVNYVDDADLTALKMAQNNGNLEMVQLLLEKGAEVNRKSGDLGYTVLHFVAETSDLEMLKCLIDAGADTKIKSRDLNTPLHVALLNKQKEVSLELIKADPSVINEFNSNNMSALHLAVLRNYDDVVEILLEHGAEVEGSHPALHLAVQCFSEEWVKALLKAGASIDCPDPERYPLICATRRIKILKILLNYSTNINIRIKEDVTPLHVASIIGSIEAVEELIQRGAEIEAKDDCNMTPALSAVKENRPQVFRYLLERGAKIFDAYTFFGQAIVSSSPDCISLLIEYGADVNARNAKNQTPLHSASYCNYQCAKMLIKNGAHLDALDNNKFTPLICAIIAGRSDVVKALIDAGADVLLNIPIHHAAHYGNVVLLILLIEAGAFINHVDCKNNTALHYATTSKEETGAALTLKIGVAIEKSVKYICNNYEECARELVARNAKLDVQNYDQMTPLHMACLKKLSKLANLYVSSGANVNIANKFNQTALHLSCIAGGLTEVELLLEHNASMGVKDDFGKTSLCYAIKFGHKKIIKFLVNLNAYLNFKNETGKTALQIACESKQTEVAKVLVELEVNLDETSADGFTALDSSIITGNIEMVKVLIGKNAALSPILSNHAVIIKKAIAFNDGSILEYLQSHGVDLSICLTSSSTSIAMTSGRLSILEHFLQNGGSPDAVHKGTSLLCAACTYQEIDCVKCLLKFGADPNHKDHEGNTPLHIACITNQYEIAKLLIEAGSDINVADNNHFTLLMYSALLGYVEITELLLSNNADLWLSDNARNTLLTYAILGQKLEIINLLLDKLMLNGRDSANMEFWRRNFFVAASKNNVELVKFFVENAIVEVDCVEEATGFTALHFAAKGNCYETACYLIENGVNVNNCNLGGETPLLYCSSGGNLKLVKLLVKKHNVDVNVCNLHGFSSLYLASVEGHLEIVKFLHRNGARIHIVNKDGNTPLHHSAVNGHLKVVEYLVQNGADVNFRNNNGKTALQLACESKQNEAAKVLVELIEVNLDETNADGFTALDSSIIVGNIEL